MVGRFGQLVYVHPVSQVRYYGIRKLLQLKLSFDMISLVNQIRSGNSMLFRTGIELYLTKTYLLVVDTF